MSFMKPKPFSELSPSDIFCPGASHFDSDRERGEFMKIDHNIEGCDHNAISADGTQLVKFDDAAMVDVRRCRIHILDLRPGDQCSMAKNLGIGYQTNTVLKVEDVKTSRHVTFARPMIFADGFGTTCPSGKVHVEKYTASAPISDAKRDDYYHLVGVDTSAIYHSYSLVLNPGGCADRHRIAVFMQAMGEKRTLAELLCEDGLTINSQAIGLLWENYIKVRETPPEYPDRDDRAEEKYFKNLQDRRHPKQYTKHESRYLSIMEARRQR